MSVVDDFLRQPRFHPGLDYEKSPHAWLIEFWNYLDDQGYLADRNLEAGRQTKLQVLLAAGEQAADAMAAAYERPDEARLAPFKNACAALGIALAAYEGRPHAAPQKPSAKTDRGEAR